MKSLALLIAILISGCSDNQSPFSQEDKNRQNEQDSSTSYLDNPNIYPVISDRSQSKTSPATDILIWKDETSGQYPCSLENIHMPFGGQEHLLLTNYSEYWWGIGVHYQEDKNFDLSGYTHLVISLKNANYPSNFHIGFEVLNEGKKERIEFLVDIDQIQSNEWNRLTFRIPEQYHEKMKSVVTPFIAFDTKDTQAGAFWLKDIYYIKNIEAFSEFHSSEIPEYGKTATIIGQDVKSIDNYLGNIKLEPNGFMSYTSVQEAGGITSEWSSYMGQWDDNNVFNADYFANKHTWKPHFVNLGLIIRDIDNFRKGGVDPQIVKGKYDNKIEQIRHWIAQQNIPVLIRIGYEFDSDDNKYQPDKYISAYKYIADRIKTNNTVLVWHSWAAQTYESAHPIEWYPGDEYVDVIAVSVYDQFQEKLGSMADINKVFKIARTLAKPIMIAEATPYGGIKPTSLESWFIPITTLIAENDVRFLSYINANWDAQLQWKGQGWGDTRVERVAEVKRYWEQLLTQNRYNLN